MVIVLALPAALGFNVLSAVQPLGAGSTILEKRAFLEQNYDWLRKALLDLGIGCDESHTNFILARFADEDTAAAAGYRPCAVCLPAEYRQWKDRR